MGSDSVRQIRSALRRGSSQPGFWTIAVPGNLFKVEILGPLPGPVESEVPGRIPVKIRDHTASTQTDISDTSARIWILHRLHHLSVLLSGFG